MITMQEARNLIGATAYDRGGQKVGDVATLYLDQATGEPEWVTVKTGLFGRRHTLVPITDAFLNPSADVQVPFAKDQVKQAPNIEPGEELTPELERRMWEHYGMSGYEEWRGEDRTRDRELGDDAEDASAQEAAPVMLRLRRVRIVAVAPVPDDN